MDVESTKLSFSQPFYECFVFVAGDSNFGPRQSRFDVRTSNFGNIGNGNDRSRTMHDSK